MREGMSVDTRWSERHGAPLSARRWRLHRWVDHVILGAALRLAASTMNRIVVRHAVHPPGTGR